MKAPRNGHDYAAQRRETFDTFREAQRNKVRLPSSAVVDYLFLAETTDADWPGLERALRAKGFRTQRAEDDLLVASFGPIPIEPESIWERERMATEIALRFDFHPDGWDLGLKD